MRGAALEILETLSQEDISKYSALTIVLELRFEDEHLRKVFVAQSKIRTQKGGESLQEFAVDVETSIFCLAYSYAPPTIQERFSTEIFINGIRDVEVKKML